MVYSYEDDKLAKTRIGLFLPTQATNYQIKINVNYIVSDPALIGQKVNAIMKLRSPDGTILKTSSFPSGFDGNQTGTAQMLTNIPKIVAQNITTEIVFTDLNKTNVLSEPVKTLPTLSSPVKSYEFTPITIINKHEHFNERIACWYGSFAVPITFLVSLLLSYPHAG